MSEKSCYAILGLRPTATQAEIEAAFLRLKRLYAPENDPSPLAAKIYAEVAMAHETLFDVAGRMAYDLEHPEFFEEKTEPPTGPREFPQASPQSFSRPAYEPVRREVWEGPETETDEEVDFTPREYLMRPIVPLVVSGSMFVIFILCVSFGWVNESKIWRLFFCTVFMVGAAWGGYFALRLSVVSKGWLPIYTVLFGVACTVLDYALFVERAVPLARVRRNRGEVNAGVLLVFLSSACFWVAALLLEKGNFFENLTNPRKLTTGRFNRR